MNYESKILKFLAKPQNKKSGAFIEIKEILGGDFHVTPDSDIIPVIKSLIDSNFVVIDVKAKLTKEKWNTIKLKITLSGLNSIKTLPYAKIGLITTALGIMVAIYSNFSSNQPRVIPEKTALQLDFSQRIEKSIDRNKVNIVIAQFRDNKEIAQILLHRFQDSLSKEGLKDFNIIAYEDNISLPSDEKGVKKELEKAGVDILLFGSFEPHGRYTNSDTARVYYKWAAKDLVTKDFPQINLLPLGNNVTSLNEVINGSGQNNYQFIVCYCLARFWLLKYSVSSNNAEFKAGIKYLHKASQAHYDETVEYINMISCQVFGTEKEITIQANYLKTHTHNPIYKLYAEFLADSGHIKRVLIAKLILKQIPFHQYGFIYSQINEFLARYSIDKRLFNDAQTYVANMIDCQPNEEKPYIFLCLLAGLEKGISREIELLEYTLSEHPEFLVCNNLLSACYYNMYISHPEVFSSYFEKAKMRDYNIIKDYSIGFEIDTIIVNKQKDIYIQPMVHN